MPKRRKPAWVFVTADGVEHPERPRDGTPYHLRVHNWKAYQKAVQDGSFYAGLGGEVTDIRKTTG